MNYYSISNLIIIAINLPMAVIIFLSSKGKRANNILGYICLTAVLWGACSYQYSIATSKDLAVFWWQIADVGSIFSTVLFYNFILAYLGIKRRILSLIIISVMIFYLYLNFFVKELFIGDLKFIFNQFYYINWPLNKISFYLVYYIFFYFFVLFYSFYLLIKDYVKATGVRRMQMKYLLSGMVIGFIGCHTLFLPVFGFNIYPYLNILIAFYTIPICYAIFKYRLMDINLAFTRLGVFVFVYTLVLGIPFGLAIFGREWLSANFGEAWFWVPMFTLLALATTGPFVYLYIQRKAEEQLLAEQRQYQKTLRQASLGMGMIKDVNRLLNLIVSIVTRAVRIEHCSVFLLQADSQQYALRAAKGFKDNRSDTKVISVESPLIKHLKKFRGPILFEEIKQQAFDYENKDLQEVSNELSKIDAELAVPCVIEDRMLGIVVMGKKRSGKMYNHDDLVVFSILANQSALAIENAQFYEEMKATHRQLFQAEKMATIGTMADGLSHQINNRLHALGFIAGDALDTIKLKKNSNYSDDVKELIIDIERALTRIQENVIQGGEIVQGLLKYTRKGEEGFSPVELDRLVTAALEMTQFKIKTHELRIIRDYDNSIPKINGNFTQLQEVFFNLIDNAYDAMMQRKSEKQEPGYQPTLKIHAQGENNHINITFEDNGMGVKMEDAHKLFTPFFTTKLSSKKGTGLGLYVIKKIIEENHEGKVNFESQYMVGTRMKMELPIVLVN